MISPSFINAISISIDAVMLAGFIGLGSYHLTRINKIESLVNEKISKEEVQDMLASELKLVNYQLGEIKNLLGQLTVVSVK